MTLLAFWKPVHEWMKENIYVKDKCTVGFRAAYQMAQPMGWAEKEAPWINKHISLCLVFSLEDKTHSWGFAEVTGGIFDLWCHLRASDWKGMRLTPHPTPMPCTATIFRRDLTFIPNIWIWLALPSSIFFYTLKGLSWVEVWDWKTIFDCFDVFLCLVINKRMHLVTLERQ